MDTAEITVGTIYINVPACDTQVKVTGTDGKGATVAFDILADPKGAYQVGSRGCAMDADQFATQYQQY